MTENAWNNLDNLDAEARVHLTIDNLYLLDASRCSLYQGFGLRELDNVIHKLRHFSQIFPTDQSVSSYSSNPSTPVSSPPPLAGSAPGWAPGAAPVSPHFTADPNRGIHMVRIEIAV